MRSHHIFPASLKLTPPSPCLLCAGISFVPWHLSGARTLETASWDSGSICTDGGSHTLELTSDSNFLLEVAQCLAENFPLTEFFCMDFIDVNNYTEWKIGALLLFFYLSEIDICLWDMDQSYFLKCDFFKCCLTTTIMNRLFFFCRHTVLKSYCPSNENIQLYHNNSIYSSWFLLGPSTSVHMTAHTWAEM